MRSYGRTPAATGSGQDSDRRSTTSGNSSGRTLAYVYTEEGELLNLEIVKQGYGHAYTRFPFSRMDEFREAERSAREQDLGLWAGDEDLASDEVELEDDEADAPDETSDDWEIEIETEDEAVPVDDEEPELAGVLPTFSSEGGLVEEARFGLISRRPDGSVLLHETDEIPAFPGVEFGWMIRLKGSREALTWGDELSVPYEGWPLMREGTVDPGQDLLVQTWAVEAGDPPGKYALTVELEGSPEIHFEFDLREPVAVAPTGSGHIGRGEGGPDSGSPQGSCIPRSQCCKVCSAGKACGDSCISRSYNCHKGRGCACDVVEVCL